MAYVDCAGSRPGPASGYSLIEAMVSLVLTVMIAGAVLGLSSASSHLASVQFDRAELQQAARASQRELVRQARMLGRGGLPASGGMASLPNGLSLAIRNNVAANTLLLDDADAAAATQPTIRAGTDIVTLRGVFASPIYQINHMDAASFSVDGGGGGTLTVDALTFTGVPQDLRALTSLIEDGGAGTAIPEALILVSPVDDTRYTVVEMDPAASSIEQNGQRLRIRFRTTGGSHADHYAALGFGGEFPPELVASRVAFVGILEEYRYYIRQQASAAGGDTKTFLSRARVYPGTETAYADDAAQLQVDLVEHVLDLQAALGFDSSLAGQWDDDLDDTGIDDQIFESPDGANDDWLFNGAADNPDQPPWGGLPAGVELPRIYYLRIGTLTRAPQRRRGTEAKVIRALEDHVYDDDPANEADARHYQRTVVRTTIDMRNLG